MPESLYRRLGGAERIAAIVEESIDRHAVNPLLAPRLRGKDLTQLKELGVEFLCAAMRLDGAERAAAIDDMVAALRAHGVGAAEVKEVLSILYALSADP